MLHHGGDKMLDYKILNKLDNLANKALDNVIGNTRRIELQYNKIYS